MCHDTCLSDYLVCIYKFLDFSCTIIVSEQQESFAIEKTDLGDLLNFVKKGG